MPGQHILITNSSRENSVSAQTTQGFTSFTQVASSIAVTGVEVGEDTEPIGRDVTKYECVEIGRQSPAPLQRTPAPIRSPPNSIISSLSIIIVQVTGHMFKD